LAVQVVRPHGDFASAAGDIAHPTYILDIPGGAGKVPVGPNYLHGQSGSLLVEDPHGVTHTL